VSDLAGFLAARLEDLEAAAKAAESIHPSPWGGIGELADAAGQFIAYDTDRNGAVVPLSVSDHIALHDPVRVLREVDAKRKILALHHIETESYLDGDGIERPGHHCWECDQREWPCPTLRALAAVWSDHPDYDPAWA
jgi:Family of unknown function (DUF6221)